MSPFYIASPAELIIPQDLEGYRAGFEAALINSFMTADEIMSGIDCGNFCFLHDGKDKNFAVLAQVWEGSTPGVAIVIDNFPITDTAQWLEAIDAIGLGFGARFVTGQGREGWERVFKEFGAVKTGIILRRVI